MRINKTDPVLAEVDMTPMIDIVFPVSYTHLTLPTIYSV